MGRGENIICAVRERPISVETMSCIFFLGKQKVKGIADARPTKKVNSKIRVMIIGLVCENVENMIQQYGSYCR